MGFVYCRSLQAEEDVKGLTGIYPICICEVLGSGRLIGELYRSACRGLNVVTHDILSKIYIYGRFGKKKGSFCGIIGHYCNLAGEMSLG